MEEKNEIIAALVMFQGKVPAITMNKKATVKYWSKAEKRMETKEYSYADLGAIYETIRPIFQELKIAVSQEPAIKYSEIETIDDQGAVSKTVCAEVSVRTMLYHESGQFLENEISLRAVDSRIQSVGSAITYAKRYGISALLGLSTEEDDDGGLGHDSGGVGKAQDASKSRQTNGKPPKRQANTTFTKHTQEAPKTASQPAVKQEQPKLNHSDEEQRKNGLIIGEQVKLIGSLVTERKIPPEKFKNFLELVYGVDSRWKLKSEKFNELCNVLLKNPKSIYPDAVKPEEDESDGF